MGGPVTEPTPGRPWIERIGLAAIALFLAGVFTIMAVASWVGGEPILAMMAAVGASMTVWAGIRTLAQG